MHKYHVGDRVTFVGSTEIPVLEIKELLFSGGHLLYKCGLPGKQHPINILTTFREEQLQLAEKEKPATKREL
ncbi:MAG: hypothetical protein KME50_12915 [Nostoc desertorum CM1-VF14]|jgi:hypothetical protein|nr:hypothetical protein [Nostoc desertorum CM1-VF14]